MFSFVFIRGLLRSSAWAWEMGRRPPPSPSPTRNFSEAPRTSQKPLGVLRSTVPPMKVPRVFLQPDSLRLHSHHTRLHLDPVADIRSAREQSHLPVECFHTGGRCRE